MNTETIPDVPRRRAMSWRSYFVRCLLWLVPMWLVMTIFGHFCFLGRDVQIGETSTPWHWFLAVRGVPEPIVKGQLVAMMTDDRHRPWFGEGQMMAKKVAGLPGDVVVVKGDRLYLNGIPYAYLRGETLDRIRRKTGHRCQRQCRSPHQAF